MYTKDDIKKQIKDMGIEPTDTVLIHTSMKAVGEVAGGADTLIDAFCEYLEDGMFIVPTHTWGNVNKDNPVFDVRKTKTCIGIVPDRAAFRKDGIRSLHPTHSIWVHGKNAKEFIQGEEKANTPAPVGFAWSRLAKINAKIVLIGVGNNKNTFIHSVDELFDLKDRLSKESYEATITDWDGKEYKTIMHPHYCTKTDDVSRYFVNFEKSFVELGVQTFGKIGDAVARVVDAKGCQEIVLRIYKNADRDVCISEMDIPKEWYIN